jgi:hypothetical protein
LIQEFGTNTLDAKALFHQLKKPSLAAKSDSHWTFTSPAMMISHGHSSGDPQVAEQKAKEDHGGGTMSLATEQLTSPVWWRNRLTFHFICILKPK